ncbi:hypothetical protein GCM10027435_02010 [Haloparvum alkalitolerans]|uniref:hypothetical protein n=1 Tax=Haloparvum alkalitolerans TaxID=1042953 RepID=UPI003CEE181D
MRKAGGPTDDGSETAGGSDAPEDAGGSDAPEAADELHIPRGELLRSRVVTDPATLLRTALEDRLTGYATVAPGETLLLDGEARGVLTFADGVPVLAYDPATDDGGADALAALAGPGPIRIELYRLPPSALAEAHETRALRVAPGAPAAELAGDPDLADRTREAAPADRREESPDGGDAVAAFLADDDRVAAIREQAREEAAERAAEWGLEDALGDVNEDALADESEDGRDGDPGVTDPVTVSDPKTTDRK